MRLALVAIAVCGCHAYDPVEELDHAEYAAPSAAIDAILADAPPARVYAIGEYHPTDPALARMSSLRRFAPQILAQLAPRAHHLVVEAWLDDGCRSAAAVESQIAQATARPPSTATDIRNLVVASRSAQLSPHGLAMTCIEHGSLLDARGRVDFLRLLELVTEKLHDTAREFADDRGVIVYGGALHNDRYPRWPLAELSYAVPLAKELGPDAVLEVDLVVPEIVAPMEIVRLEPWFPLLARAAPGRSIVWKRGPGSYVVILPAQSDAVARIAMPVAQR